MKKTNIAKMIGILTALTLLITFSTVNVSAESTLEYEPGSHDFGYKLVGETDSTTFQIWTCGGCGGPTLVYELNEDEDWIEVSPTEGKSEGEKDTITVTIDTTSLALGEHTSDIQISSNLGLGVFTVRVTVVENTPILKIGKISGGIVGVSADILNTGDTTAENLVSTISVEGGYMGLIDITSICDSSQCSGCDGTLEAGASKSESTDKFVLGFGDVKITVTVEADNAETATKTVDALVLGFFVLIT